MTDFYSGDQTLLYQSLCLLVDPHFQQMPAEHSSCWHWCPSFLHLYLNLSSYLWSSDLLNVKSSLNLFSNCIMLYLIISVLKIYIYHLIEVHWKVHYLLGYFFLIDVLNTISENNYSLQINQLYSIFSCNLDNSKHWPCGFKGTF